MKAIVVSISLLFVGIGCCSPAVVREATYKATQNNTKSLQLVKDEALPYVAVLRDLMEQMKARGLKEVALDDGTSEKGYLLNEETLESLLQLTGRQEVGSKVYETLYEMWDSRLGAYIIRSKAIEAGVKVDRDFTVRSP